jgi:preprotein translocase subunit SecF
MKLNKFFKVHKASLSFLLILMVFSVSFLFIIETHNLGGEMVGTAAVPKKEIVQESDSRDQNDGPSEVDVEKSLTNGGSSNSDVEVMEKQEIELVESRSVSKEKKVISEEEIRKLKTKTKKKIINDTANKGDFNLDKKYLTVYPLFGGNTCGDGVCQESMLSSNENSMTCPQDCLNPSEAEKNRLRIKEFFYSLFGFNN